MKVCFESLEIAFIIFSSQSSENCFQLWWKIKLHEIWQSIFLVYELFILPTYSWLLPAFYLTSRLFQLHTIPVPTWTSRCALRLSTNFLWKFHSAIVLQWRQSCGCIFAIIWTFKTQLFYRMHFTLNSAQSLSKVPEWTSVTQTRSKRATRNFMILLEPLSACQMKLRELIARCKNSFIYMRYSRFFILNFSREVCVISRDSSALRTSAFFIELDL